MNEHECQRSSFNTKEKGMQCGISCMVRTSLFAIAGICIGVITFWVITHRNQLESVRHKLVKLNRKTKVTKSQIDVTNEQIRKVDATMQVVDQRVGETLNQVTKATEATQEAKKLMTEVAKQLIKSEAILPVDTIESKKTDGDTIITSQPAKTEPAVVNINTIGQQANPAISEPTQIGTNLNAQSTISSPKESDVTSSKDMSSKETINSLASSLQGKVT